MPDDASAKPTAYLLAASAAAFSSARWYDGKLETAPAAESRPAIVVPESRWPRLWSASPAVLAAVDARREVETVARLVRHGGFFAFSIVHPCFPGWEAKQANPSWQPGHGYYQEGWWRADGPAHGLRPKVGANHRMLSTYLNTLVRHGLLIEEVAEPMPEADWIAERPDIGPVPVYLVARCRKRRA